MERTNSRCREASIVVPWRRGVGLNEWMLPKFKMITLEIHLGGITDYAGLEDWMRGMREREKSRMHLYFSLGATKGMMGIPFY